MAGRRASKRYTREKLHSPGRPSAWLREHHCRFWQFIAQGRTSEEAAADAGISTPLGPRWFRSSGGMPPTHLAPSAPAPSGRFLTFREREEIAIELARGSAVRAIARKLGRSPSTISREVRRNAATRGGNLDYRASVTQWHAERAGRRPRPGKLAAILLCALMSRSVLLVRSRTLMVSALPVLKWYGRSGALFFDRAGAGRSHGAQSR
jgi:transposase-like protein